MPLQRWVSCLILLLSCLNGCVYLPKSSSLKQSYAIPAQLQSRISLGLTPEGPTSKPRATLIDAPDAALTYRLDLIDAADTSIDLQYFLWHNDASGILVIEKILAAADRGVRVRALVDDIQMEGLVNRLNALDDHPNIEIRIFNPFSIRWRYELGILRLAEFAIDGNRLNHRMHNKLLVADNQLAILGGRNIGDDYFGLSDKRNFIDLDILLSGSIVPELTSGFDVYWNSQWAHPVNMLLNLAVIPDQLDKVRKRIRRRVRQNPDMNALAQTQLYQDTLSQAANGAKVNDYAMLIDDPDVSWFDKPNEIAEELTEIALSAEQEVLIVTPYLVPTGALLEIARTLVARGIKIKVVTNSLQTNDVVIAQAAYSQYRKRVLAAGVELYELRGDAKIGILSGGNRSKDISLHTKYIIFDERHVFLGSMNLDPRSLYLNTELGVMLESTELASSLRTYFDQLTLPENAWRVLDQPHGVQWQAGEEIIERTPAKGLWQRLRYWFYRLLPVSRQL